MRFPAGFEKLGLAVRNVWISYPLAVVQRRWTRWATRARDLAAAVVAEDYARAAQIQAEFDALTEEARMHSRAWIVLWISYHLAVVPRKFCF